MLNHYRLKWIVNSVAILSAIAHFGAKLSSTVYPRINSDMLYMPAVIKDIISPHYTTTHWAFPGAPYQFPDLVFYAPLYAMTGNIAQAHAAITLLFLFIQCMLVAWLACLLLSPHHQTHRTFLLLLSVVLFHSVLFWQPAFMSPLLEPVTHSGAAWIALLCIGLLFKGSPSVSPTLKIGVFFLVAATSFSDRLFLLNFTFPVLTVGLFLWVWRRTWFRLYLSAFVIAGLASLVGWGCSYLWPWGISANLPYHKGGLGMFWSKTLLFVSLVRKDFHWGMALFALLTTGGIVYAFLQWRRALQEVSESEPPSLAILWPILFFIPVLTFTGTMASGFYQDWAGSRYLFAANLILLLFPLTALLHVFHRFVFVPNNRVALLFVIGVVMGGVGVYTGDLKPTFHYQPARVRAMDRLQKKYGLRHGLATYWYAKELSLFSSTGLWANAVTKAGNVYPWVTNLQWYARPPNSQGKVRYNFILVDPSMDVFLVSDKYGPPHKVLWVGNNRLFLYPEQNGIQREIQEDLWMIDPHSFPHPSPQNKSLRPSTQPSSEKHHSRTRGNK